MAVTEIKLSQIRRAADAISEVSRPTVSTEDDKKVGITTLGCKVNAFESEMIGEALKSDDWRLVPANESADLYLINTCTVTREADRQARQEVRKAVKRNPDALVVVTGCYAQMEPDACASIPGVDLVLGNDRKLDMHQLLPQLQQGELPKVLVGDLDQHVSLPDRLLGGFDARTRAFVQIQQGCGQGCTFCIIHVARGPSRSLPPNLILRQIQRLVLNGYPEVVVCGVDLGSYGDDFPDLDTRFDLVKLLQAILQLDYDADNPFRIRLSSIDPHHISDRLIDLMADNPRICPHLHLSLQSGSTMVLKRMKRRYDADQVLERIGKLRSKLPHVVMSADVMVGFPTETEAQYLETERMLQTLNIAYPHVFSYSERQGTPAARIPQDKQVPVALRKQRNKRLRDSVVGLQEQLLASKIGHEAWVLPEQQSSKAAWTPCRGEDYIACQVDSGKVKPGRWMKVRFDRLENGQLVAE